MSVISLSSEDEEVEDDECFIINYDEEQKTLLKSHTVMIVVDDDDNKEDNGINRCLPELEMEMKSNHLQIRSTEEENSKDPFAMCSEFDLMNTGNEEGIPSIENTLLSTNVKPVHIEDITQNTTILKTNNTPKVIDPNTDDSNFFMDPRKEISTDEKNNLSECCESLNSAQRNNNNQGLASFNKRFAERLALLIKEKAVKTCNASGREEHLGLGTKNVNNVDDIINKVSKSSFHVDWNIDLSSKHNDKSCSKNKIAGRRRQKINIEDKDLNLEDIERLKNNQISPENEGNQGCLESNECEPCEPTTTNSKKRGRKRGWRKRPQTKLNGLSNMSNKQKSNNGDRNQLSTNNSMQESSGISINHSGNSKKEESITGRNISHDLTEQAQAHCDSKSSATNSDHNHIRKTKEIKGQSLVSETSSKYCIQNTTAGKAINKLVESIFKNSPLEHKKANGNLYHPKLHLPPAVSLHSPPAALSLTPPPFQFLQSSGKNCLGALKEKQDTANQKPNSFSTVCESVLNYESPKRVVAGLNDSDANENSASPKLMDACTTGSIALNQSKNNSPCFQQEKYRASSGYRNMTKKDKEKSVKVTECLVSSVHSDRDLEEKDITNTTIDSNLSSNQKNLNEISTNSQLKTYSHYYNLVFDDNGEYLCMKMGDRVLLTAKEARSCKSRIVTAEKFTCQQLRANEVQLAKSNFFEALRGFQRSFVPLYFKLIEKVIDSKVHIENKEQFTLIILTWFLKMYLRVTTLAPEFMDCVTEIKVNVRALILNANCMLKTIIEIFDCNETDFESKCCTVVQYMHSIFNSTQSLKEYESNGRKEESLKMLKQAIENVQKPGTSGQDVNVQSTIENNVVASKPISLLEKLLNKRDISVIVKKNKALELNKLDPLPFKCNGPIIEERDQEKPGVGEYKENESIVRDSRLNQLFENACTSLPTLAENSTHSNEVSLQSRSTLNYSKQQTQFNTSGARNSSQESATVSSTSNTHNTRDQELMQSNLTERERHISQTVTSKQRFEVRSSNNSATQCPNHHNRDTQFKNIRSQDQIPKSWEISSDGSSLSHSSSNNNVLVEPQLDSGKYTRELNHQTKRKFTDSELYSTKRLMAYQNDSISNKWAGNDNMGNYPVHNFKPSSLVNKPQLNSKSYTTPNQIRPISLSRHPPPPYSRSSSYQYHHSVPPYSRSASYQNPHPPPPYSRSSSYQYCHGSQNTTKPHKPNTTHRYSQPNSLIEKPVEGQSALFGHQFQGDRQGTKHNENCIDIHENINHYSLKVNNFRNGGNSPSTEQRPSSETVQESTPCNEKHIAITINNYSISNVVPPTSVVNHVNSHDTSWYSSRKDIQLEKFPLVPEPDPKETIHYL